MCSFFLRFYLMYSSLLGGFLKSIWWYFFIRFLESHWFVWVTQINHLPMDISQEKNLDWVTLQVVGTCNVTPVVLQ